MLNRAEGARKNRVFEARNADFCENFDYRVPKLTKIPPLVKNPKVQRGGIFVIFSTDSGKPLENRHLGRNRVGKRGFGERKI